MTKNKKNEMAKIVNTNSTEPSNPHRRESMKLLLLGGLGVAGLAKGAGIKSTNSSQSNCTYNYNQHINYLGEHQEGVITPDCKEAIFVAFDLSITRIDQLKKLFQTISQRIAFLTQPQSISRPKNDKFPPTESGMLGLHLEPDLLTITLSVSHSLFDGRFGLAKKKPKHLIKMTRFPNDRLETKWCGGDLVLQFCAGSRESVIYALRDIILHTSDQMKPIWKIDGFLPARDIDRHSTAINLFGFKDGTGNANNTDKAQMDDLVWVTKNNDEPAWCLGGSYQAIRLIRFDLAFWDRTPLEDQENDFGRYKDTGAPIGMQQELDDPQFNKDPHGDRILFSSHMRRAEPRTPTRHVAKLRRRSFSYSLGVLPSGELDMGLIFVCYQNDLQQGFIETQKRLNGEPLERYIKPFGGGYYFVLPGIKDKNDYLGKSLLEN